MSSPRTTGRSDLIRLPAEPIKCSGCNRILPILSQGPDWEQWEAWQKPHWTEVLRDWPTGKHEALIIDSIRAVGTLVLLIGVVIGLLAGLG